MLVWHSLLGAFLSLLYLPLNFIDWKTILFVFIFELWDTTDLLQNTCPDDSTHTYNLLLNPKL